MSPDVNPTANPTSNSASRTDRLTPAASSAILLWAARLGLRCCRMLRVVGVGLREQRLRAVRLAQQIRRYLDLRRPLVHTPPRFLRTELAVADLIREPRRNPVRALVVNGAIDVHA